MRVRRLLLGAAVLAASAILHAQKQAVFRTETNYVEVDAVVTDAKGHFVPGLGAADFEVSEQLRPQSISTFTYVDLPIGPGKVSSTPSPVLFRPDLAQGERLAADRIYLLYLNGENPALVRNRAREFVRDFLQPNDIAAVWNAGAPPNGIITFTNDKATLLGAIGPGAKTAPGAPLPPREVASAEGGRLRDAINWLDGIQGRRKSLILFTESWQIPMGTIRADARAQREQDVADWLQGGPGGIMAGPWMNPTDITNRSDVHIYAWDVRGLVAPETHLSTSVSATPINPTAAAMIVEDSYRAESPGVMMLRAIADQTGGLAFVGSNDTRGNFARIVEDNSQYYILGYYSPNAKRDGEFRSLSVRVSRPGLNVRARNGYVAR
jgi:VWFA-related protein